MKQRLFRDQKVQAGASAMIDHLKQTAIPEGKLKAGSLEGRVPVIIDSKTIIFAKPDQDVNEVRARYSRRVWAAPEETEDQE